MKTLILFLFPLTILATSCEKKSKTDLHQTYKDSLNGTYTDLIKVNGVPDHFNFYINYKLTQKGFLKNGQFYDLVQVDSLGNILTHDPLLVWDNYEEFEFSDLLKFKIKNVDSLTLYLYYYTTDQATLKSKGQEVLQNMAPIDFRVSPLIKISKSEIGQNRELYFLWGYLVKRTESVDTVFEEWRYSHGAFKLNSNTIVENETLENELKEVEKKLVKNPNDFWNNYERGKKLMALERYEEAIKAFNKAQEIEPENRYPFADKALAKYKMGDKVGACNDWKSKECISYLEKYCQ